MSDPTAPPSRQRVVGGHQRFQFENDAQFLALIEKHKEKINSTIGDNYKLKKVLHVTKQVVAGLLYHVTAEFEREGDDETVKYIFMLLDRPWDPPDEHVLEHRRVY
uniref:Cystatin domain-containing protein n=1 Tax=Lutzomyia longipalpis TaxID=7200 RepID=A0A1B0CMU5_LUTLO